VLKKRIQSLLAALNRGIIGKEEVVGLALLSAAAGESIFLLGNPGVAKSLIARRLKFAFADAQAFEYLMNRFSTPDEIFGPISISKLKNEDKYERLTARYLPSADIVFLDEIWKASPSIQNALLTVLNEKIYRNGEQEMRLPLKAILAASNELPAEGEGLEALWDRFLVRYIVDGVQDAADFRRVIGEPLDAYTDHVDSALKIRQEEYRLWSKDIDKIEIPEEVYRIIELLREKIKARNEERQDGNSDADKSAPLYVSDRRWRKIVRLLRTSALLNDRRAVDLMDCFLIAHCLWDTAEQCEEVRELVASTIELHGYSAAGNIDVLSATLQEYEKEIRQQTEKVSLRTRREPKSFGGYYKIVSSDFAGMFVAESDYKAIEQLIEQSPRGVFAQHNLPIYWRAGSKSEHIGVFNQLRFEMDNTTTKDISFIAPSAEMRRHWDALLDNFAEELQISKEQLDTQGSIFAEAQIFIAPHCQHIAKTAFSRQIARVEQLQISAQALRHHYTSIAAV